MPRHPNGITDADTAITRPLRSLRPSMQTSARRGILSLAAAVVMGLAALVTVEVALAGIDGNITSLTATEAPNPGQTITITAVLYAIANVNPSNLSYRIIAPDQTTVVATRSVSIPFLTAGSTFTDTWTTTNSSFPTVGTYTVTACWGKDPDWKCQHDMKSTTFYSVPTLGGWLGLFGLALLGWFVWRRRSDFTPGGNRP